MPIPDYQSVMLPLLRLASTGGEYRFRDALERLAVEFNLTSDERAELLPSGTAPTFDSRVGWARTYLKQAGLFHSPRRGVFQITEEGKRLLAANHNRIDNALLEQYASFREFKARRRDKPEATGVQGVSTTSSDSSQGENTSSGVLPDRSELSPEDALAAAYTGIRQNLEADLLEQVKTATPAFFERLVVDLLIAMGYGGSRQDAGRAIGRSGDGGIDGIINEDRLGLDVIYVQAKRWEASVGRPEIQKFAGALQGQRATKGVFITTSNFTRDAKEYANVIHSKIILMDGDRLASLMVDFNVGVTLVGSYELKKIDSDYFEGE